jgi:hypothetical protein
MEYPLYFKAIKRKYRYNPKKITPLVLAKDKAWAILSDYTRMRDFVLYGTCVSCGVRFEHWRDSQGGHYIPMGAGGTSSGFYERNIHGQCMHCNKFGEMEAGGNFKDELINRYGEGIIDELKTVKQELVKADEWWYIQKIKHLYGLFQELREQYPDKEYPDYICG